MNMDRSSFSRYSCFTTCRRQFFWKYVQGLEPKDTPKALAIGSAFHLGAADKGTPEQRQGMWHQIGMLARQYWNVTGECEVKREFDLGPVQIVYIADGIEDGYLIEYKTTSDASAENVTAHSLSLQLRLGCALFGLRGTKLRLIKKPQIRLKKGESEHEFDQRYLNLFKDDPQNHLLEILLPPNTDGAVREFLHIYEEMKRCETARCWPMAVPHICKGKVPCSYMPLCADEETNIALFKSKENENNADDE